MPDRSSSLTSCVAIGGQGVGHCTRMPLSASHGEQAVCVIQISSAVVVRSPHAFVFGLNPMTMKGFQGESL